MAVPLEENRHPPVRQVRVKAPVNREAELRLGQWIAAQAAAGAAPAQARWTEVAPVREGIRSGIEASLPPPAAEAAARLMAARAVRAGVLLEPAAAEALPAMEEAPAEVPAALAGEALVVAAAGGDK